MEEDPGSATDESERKERILIPISNPHTIEELVNLSTLIKSKQNTHDLFALTIVKHDSTDSDSGRKAEKMLRKAAIAASSTDVHIHELLRYDLNIVNGITSVVRERTITDLVLGLHLQKGISESFLGNLTEGILAKCNITTFVYKPVQPIATIKKHIIIIPEHAENEIGFPFWLSKIRRYSKS